jgi:hypothetical protein
VDLTPELKAKIDAMSYEDLLRRWRFAPTGTEIFQGESGDYYAAEMARKRDADPLGAVGASKRIGFYERRT